MSTHITRWDRYPVNATDTRLEGFVKNWLKVLCHYITQHAEHYMCNFVGRKIHTHSDVHLHINTV